MIITSTLDPVAITIGPISVRWYGIFFAGGFLIGYFIILQMFKKLKYNQESLDKLLLMVFGGTIIGSRIFHCFIYEPHYYLNHPLDILKVWEGGLASHGGTLGLILSIYLFTRKSEFSFLHLLDLLSIPSALVASGIRVGNFFNSEILGIPTYSSYGVVFAHLNETFPRHPVQLYEAVAYFITFIVLILINKFYKTKGTGFLLGIMLTIIFTTRIILEPFKVEQAEYSTGINLSVGQILSLPFVLVGIMLILYSLAINPKYKKR